MTKNKLQLMALKNTSIILFVIIFVIFGIIAPKFFALQNFEDIATGASYIGIMAVGMTFVLLTGGIDLSVGSVMYVSAVVAGLLIKNYNVPVWVALIAAMIIGVGVGAFNAFAIIRLKILPFIVTLSTMVAVRGIGLFLTKSKAVTFPDSVASLGSVRIIGIPIPILIFGIVVLIAFLFLAKTPLGRQIYAVGNDIESAKKTGIDTDKALITVYVVCGLLAAIGGIISVAQLGIVNAGFGDGDEFDAIAAAVLGGASLFGGVGSVFPGTVIGTVLIQMVQAGLVYVQADLYIQPIISAVIIFLAVFLDSVRVGQITKLERRNIRTEKA